MMIFGANLKQNIEHILEQDSVKYALSTDRKKVQLFIQLCERRFKDLELLIEENSDFLSNKHKSSYLRKIVREAIWSDSSDFIRIVNELDEYKNIAEINEIKSNTSLIRVANQIHNLFANYIPIEVNLDEQYFCDLKGGFSMRLTKDIISISRLHQNIKPGDNPEKENKSAATSTKDREKGDSDQEHCTR